MRLQSKRVMATGLTIVLLSASLGVSSSGYVLLVCFLGLVTGVNLMAVGFWMADNPSPTNLTSLPVPGVRQLATFPRRNLAVVGLATAASAVTAAAGEASPVLCGGFYALLLLGVSLITAGVLASSVKAGDGVVQAAS